MDDARPAYERPMILEFGTLRGVTRGDYAGGSSDDSLAGGYDGYEFDPPPDS